MSPYPRVAFLLNAYQRVEQLPTQLQVVCSQTVKPSAIYLWQNGASVTLPQLDGIPIVSAEASRNLGVWARLAFALNIEEEYVCMLDDDTLPGPRWIENCLNTSEQVTGLLGTRGLRFRSRKSYLLAEPVGWQVPNEQIERVDIVGHAWFFRSEWLRAFWSLPRFKCERNNAGEDFHFSFSLQKVLGLGTYVPPHPPDNKDLWGAQPETSEHWGNAGEPVSRSTGATKLFQSAYRYYISSGFQLVNERTPLFAPAVALESVAIHPWTRRYLGRLPGARSLWRFWHRIVDKFSLRSN